jgi:hypothetical protein
LTVLILAKQRNTTAKEYGETGWGDTIIDSVEKGKQYSTRVVSRSEIKIKSK